MRRIEPGARRGTGTDLPERSLRRGRAHGHARAPRRRPAAYVLHGDERREALCSATVSLHSRGAVEGFEDAVTGSLEDATLPLPAQEQLLAGARACLSACARRAMQLSAGFRESMQRRHLRDRERPDGYFADLLAELDRRVARGRTTGADAQEKRQVLERERSVKLEALSARYIARLEVRPVALLVVEAPVHRMTLHLRRRKAARELEVEYDDATRRLIPPACDGCGLPAQGPRHATMRCTCCAKAARPGLRAARRAPLAGPVAAREFGKRRSSRRADLLPLTRSSRAPSLSVFSWPPGVCLARWPHPRSGRAGEDLCGYPRSRAPGRRGG
jgi:hypothetical protein